MGRRVRVAAVAALLAGVVAPSAQAFDPAVEAKNFSKTLERQSTYTTPAGELLLPTSGIAGFLARGGVALAYLPLLWASGFFGDQERDAMRRAIERARGVSAQPSQDLEALRTRTDLMDEVHDAQ